MQIQNLLNTNRTSFEGGIKISGELSKIPANQVKTTIPKLKTLFANKNFDLFIKEDFEANQVILMVQKPKHFAKYDKPYIKYSISSYANDKDSELYYFVAKHAAERYEKLLKKNRLAAKCKEFFNRFFNRFRNSLSNQIDKYEV